MGIHETNENALPDSMFFAGQISFVVIGNSCRLLDGRRTPGFIEAYFPETAMFRWRITDFEDKGSYWDVAAENITQFQMLIGSAELEPDEVSAIEKRIRELDQHMELEIEENEKNKTQRDIFLARMDVAEWLDANSAFFGAGLQLEFDNIDRNLALAQDLKNYMTFQQLEELENKTAAQLVLNPASEWIKGMAIVLAEMGIVAYNGKIPRANDMFEGIGEKEQRRKYLAHRIGFVREVLCRAGIDEVLVYRGMSTEGEWEDAPRKSLTSWTFSITAALSFADLDRNTKSKNAYVIKRTVPIDQLFMTCLETQEMNQQYKESEAILFYDQSKGIY